METKIATLHHYINTWHLQSAAKLLGLLLCQCSLISSRYRYYLHIVKGAALLHASCLCIFWKLVVGSWEGRHVGKQETLCLLYLI